MQTILFPQDLLVSEVSGQEKLMATRLDSDAPLINFKGIYCILFRFLRNKNSSSFELKELQDIVIEAQFTEEQSARTCEYFLATIVRLSLATITPMMIDSEIAIPLLSEEHVIEICATDADYFQLNEIQVRVNPDRFVGASSTNCGTCSTCIY
jgi:hypothetical protein